METTMETCQKKALSDMGCILTWERDHSSAGSRVEWDCHRPVNDNKILVTPNPIVANQKEKKMSNETETGVIQGFIAGTAGNLVTPTRTPKEKDP